MLTGRSRSSRGRVGLGRAGALALARAGARVLVSDLNEAGVRETAELMPRPAAARALVADAGSAADAERTVRAAVDASAPCTCSTTTPASPGRGATGSRR